MSTLAVVEQILRETELPMSVREIVERAGESLPTKSKTPDTVVARDLSMDIKKKGEESIFIRASPGRYTMRALHLRRLREQEAAVRSNQATAVLASAIRHERVAAFGTKKAIPAERKETAAQ